MELTDETPDELVTDSVPLPPSLQAVIDRCEAAGIEFNRRSTSGSREYLAILIGKGDSAKIRTSVVQQEAVDLLKYKFEDWLPISGFKAILDKDREEIVAAVDLTELRRQGWRTIGAAEEVVQSGSDQMQRIIYRASTQDETGYQLEIVSREVSQLSYLFPFRSSRFRASTHSPSALGTLRIKNVKINDPNRAKSLLVELTQSLFFDIDVRCGVTLSLRPHLEDRTLSRRIEKPGIGDHLSFPRQTYSVNPVKLYLHAAKYRQGSLGQFQTLEFFCYYQVIEHFFPIFSRQETIERVRLKLKHPTMNMERDEDISRIIDIVKASPQFDNEREQLRLTVERCCPVNDLNEFLTSSPDILKTLGNKTMIRSVHTINPMNKNSPISRQVADRIYDLRCRIVHAKDGQATDKGDALLPFSPETEHLKFDISLVRYVAQSALIASSTKLSL